MKKTDVLIIGSSAAGLVAATTGKRVHPNKDFTVVTKAPQTLIPCGIPYVFGTVGTTDKDILPAEMMFEKTGVDTIHDEIIEIDREKKTAILKSGEEIQYDKLVIGTSSNPLKPKWLKGVDLKGVFAVPKDKVYLDEMQTKLNDAKKIVTIGAGFIGVEISDELVKAGKEVVLIERLPHILGLAFDKDISMRATEIIEKRGVKLETNCTVKELIGTDKVEAVLLEDGRRIEADAVILSLGYTPNSKLAAESGLAVNKQGFISVDEYMRTEDSDVFAVGDCAEKRDFITRKPSQVMLASTACAEARIAGMNLFKLSAIKTFSGTISIFSTALGEHGFGVAGLTERVAEAENFDFVTGVFDGIDRHPGSLPDTHKQYVKLVVGRESGVILGGEVAGGLSVGDLINTIGFIIQNRMTLNGILTAQVGTHPLMTASPAGYPLIKAAENAYSNILAVNKQ
ncbi:FAD-dependent oxidoreductase [Lentimicrobium sp. S6]|uniref:FAD-dependent oxidoreductase n=1 Tax=Lentimicrobium sp. S6 TaxID=2735872 RepID=UPI001C12D5E9|nr:FAD-dependent oxidoreductase [Lentimicrobium sp. S6]